MTMQSGRHKILAECPSPDILLNNNAGPCATPSCAATGYSTNNMPSVSIPTRTILTRELQRSYTCGLKQWQNLHRPSNHVKRLMINRFRPTGSRRNPTFFLKANQLARCPEGSDDIQRYAHLAPNARKDAVARLDV